MSTKIKNVSRKHWTIAVLWGLLYISFVIWLAWDDKKSLFWLFLTPIIIDMFTTKYIPWSWWKKYKPDETNTPKSQQNPNANATKYLIWSWIDAIVFALVAVYFINIFFFQNYQIPSSSLEKTLRVGDYLFVSKMSYGPRVPNTPLSMPLMQHTMPKWLGGGKSFVNWPHWEYKRLRGWDTPKKGDIVVFNFPAGDTVCTKIQNPDYYTLCFYYGKETVHSRKDKFGDIIVRPVDRRENYVKRCVGTPGDTLQIINNVIHVNGKPEHHFEGQQLNYIVFLNKGKKLSKDFLDHVGINIADRNKIEEGIYHFPLTQTMLKKLSSNPNIDSIIVEPESMGGQVYPLGHTQWTRDNYGPIYIPKKGDSIRITQDNYWIYKRIADAYEHQPMQIDDMYVFKMDYYWMMGDNRHGSSDSRYWGFVPEDHIVGRPVFIWLSTEKDNKWFNGHIRWRRIGADASK